MESRELTFGEKLVGLTFNPSGDSKVQQVKELCAKLTDILYDDIPEDNERTFLQDQLFNKAIFDILDAQMTSVKLLTLKY